MTRLHIPDAQSRVLHVANDLLAWKGESPAPFLYCVGHKERELARKYGDTFVNQAPYTNLIRGSTTPNDFIEVLEKYLAISPHILPSSPECQDCKPLLRHPHLQPEHIFLDEDGKISTLTGWQYSSILPSLLVCGNPLIFSNPDPLPPKDIEEPGLPDNYSRLTREEQKNSYSLWRDRMLYYYYALFTSLINKPHAKMMLTPFQPVISNLVSSANRPWKGDSITLKCALIRFVQLWFQIMSKRTKHKRDKEIPKCPLDLELHAVKDLFDLEERWNDAEALKETWRTQIGIAEDGWIDGDKYDEAVKVNEALKKQWLDARSDSSETPGSAEEQEQWPFDDYEEPE
ncbi:Phosphotransferase enzyme [Ascosphaera pollenicola]|nr:Phosphotransferase enzyme [Ascosphaera pollenicola]